MTKNQIKKELYKQKPKASLKGFRNEHYCFQCVLDDGSILNFEVPEEEGKKFNSIMEAQLLIRWLSSWMTYKSL